MVWEVYINKWWMWVWIWWIINSHSQVIEYWQVKIVQQTQKVNFTPVQQTQMESVPQYTSAVNPEG